VKVERRIITEGDTGTAIKRTSIEEETSTPVKM
jgi:hypothetical protein